jgi:hypothetical protein
MGNEGQETDAELARAYVGAMYLAEGLADLKRLSTEFHALMEALSKR